MFLGLDKWERQKQRRLQEELPSHRRKRKGGRKGQQQGQIDQLIEGLARWSHKQWVQLQANSLEPRWARDLGPSPYFPKALGAAGAAGDPPGSPL